MAANRNAEVAARPPTHFKNRDCIRTCYVEELIAPRGPHFPAISRPTPLPDRVLRAMDTPIIDHRGPDFAKLAKRCLEGVKTIFKTTNPVIIYTATGTGAWEAALVNTLSPGDKVLMVETG